MIDWKEEMPAMNIKDRMAFKEVTSKESDEYPPDEVALPNPDGMTCVQCLHFDRCRDLVGALAEWDTCDWSPSRFREAAIRL